MPIRSKNNHLFFDFRFNGVRCREYTKLTDTIKNRKTMEKVLQKIEAEISVGSFNYANYFPNSKKAELFQDAKTNKSQLLTIGRTPLYKDFAETWFVENSVLWRNSHKETVLSTINRHLIPFFKDTEVARVTKEKTLQLRGEVAQLKGRGKKTLAPKTVNRILQIHSQIMAEAADRYGFPDPTERIKRLKQPKTNVNPFSLDEVQLLINQVRSDYRDYFIVRFFTGLRTGELHGLQWKYIDFSRREILIRETLVRGNLEYTKTDGSQREVHMTNLVYEAMLRQKQATFKKSNFVFCNTEGKPLDTDNVTSRIWYPLLNYLGLEKRRPYQTRHTTASIWLGAGENPEWVARQLGHTSTEMLFKTYSRYIPNLTRNDGMAVNQILNSQISINNNYISA